MRQILITGANGNIGTAVIQHLSELDKASEITGTENKNFQAVKALGLKSLSPNFQKSQSPFVQ